MDQGPRHSSPIRRRGGTFHGLLITLSIIGALGVTTLILGPRYLVAGIGEPPPAVAAGHERHQALIDDLARLIAQSVGVLAIHGRESTPYEEVVLWLADNDPNGRDGKADERELAVLSHSSILHTIPIYRMTGEGEGNRRTPRAPRGSPAFCDGFRADPRVVPLILVGGVSDMRVEPVGERQDEWSEGGRWGGIQRLRLSLTWAPDSADGADEASVLVDTVMFTPGAGE